MSKCSLTWMERCFAAISHRSPSLAAVLPWRRCLISSSPRPPALPEWQSDRHLSASPSSPEPQSSVFEIIIWNDPQLEHTLILIKAHHYYIRMYVRPSIPCFYRCSASAPAYLLALPTHEHTLLHIMPHEHTHNVHTPPWTGQPTP